MGRFEKWQVKKKDSIAGGGEGGKEGRGGLKRGRSQMRTHQMEGRKREEWVGELRNVAGHKRGLTNWRGGRGKSGLVSFKTWHITNEDSLPGGEKVGEAGW